MIKGRAIRRGLFFCHPTLAYGRVDTRASTVLQRAGARGRLEPYAPQKGHDICGKVRLHMPAEGFSTRLVPYRRASKNKSGDRSRRKSTSLCGVAAARDAFWQARCGACRITVYRFRNTGIAVSSTGNACQRPEGRDIACRGQVGGCGRDRSVIKPLQRQDVRRGLRLQDI